MARAPKSHSDIFTTEPDMSKEKTITDLAALSESAERARLAAPMGMTRGILIHIASILDEEHDRLAEEVNEEDRQGACECNATSIPHRYEPEGDCVSKEKTFLQKHAAAMVCHRQEYHPDREKRWVERDPDADAAFDALADYADELAAKVAELEEAAS